MAHKAYLESKSDLKQAANRAKAIYSGDKPKIRQAINETADMSLRLFLNREKVGEKRAALYEKWLSAYACTLHPKNN